MTLIITEHNRDYLSDMQANKYPLILRSFECQHRTRLTLPSIRELARISTQTSTITLTGTAPDGDYTLTFSGTLADGTPFEEELDAFTASTDTNDEISAGLEAIIEAARATVLAGIVADESVSTNVQTVIFEEGVTGTIALEVPVGAVATIARSFVAVLDQDTRLRGWPVMPVFYEGVMRGHTILNRIVAIAGLAAVTLVVGDANSANGLLTSTSLASTGIVQTIGAGENARRYESAFSPQLTITSTTNSFRDATAGDFTVEIEYTPVPLALTG